MDSSCSSHLLLLLLDNNNISYFSNVEGPKFTLKKTYGPNIKYPNSKPQKPNNPCKVSIGVNYASNEIQTDAILLFERGVGWPKKVQKTK